MCARSNLWTSVESIGCPSCTTCAPRSAPLRAAPTRRAMQSQRTRAACPLTACRGCFWDSATWRSLRTLWPSLAFFSLSLCSTFIQRWTWLSDFHRLLHKHTYSLTHTQTLMLWLYVTHKMWDSGPSYCGSENMFLESIPSLTTHHSTRVKETSYFPCSRANPQSASSDPIKVLVSWSKHRRAVKLSEHWRSRRILFLFRATYFIFHTTFGAAY